MKRTGHLFEQIVTFDNLFAAAQKAFRGQKKYTARGAAFYFHLEPELLALEQELRAGSYHPVSYNTFVIYEPKERYISASDFRDRVVHHAICNLLEPLLDRRMIFDSYACRIGKGTHTAVTRAQQFARRFPYFLKCDIRKYFESIDHEVLKQILTRKLKDQALLNLLSLIIDHAVPEYEQDKGLPIGALTSQLFANLYLSELDHFLKDQLGVKGYLRYMDDVLLFGDKKAALREWLSFIRQFVAERLLLELKEEALVLAPVSQGIPFLGFRVFRGPKSSFGEKLLAHFCEGSYIMKWSMTVTGSNRVNRGGSWNNIAENCRAANRNNDDPGNRNHNLGFRLVSTRYCQRVWFTDHARVHKALSRSCSGAGYSDRTNNTRAAAFGRLMLEDRCGVSFYAHYAVL